MDIVKNIIKIRREKGISQEYIAIALGVDTAVIKYLQKMITFAGRKRKKL